MKNLLKFGLVAALLCASPAIAATPIQGTTPGAGYVTVKVNKNGEIVGAFVADGTNELLGSVNLADGTSTALFAAQGAGVRGCLGAMKIQGVAATTVVTLALLDGVTTKQTYNVPAGVSDILISFPRPFCSTANTAINVQLSGVPTGSVRVNGNGNKQLN